MAKLSAGLLIYRFRNNNLEVFLVHPGGPFWVNKDPGSWSMPKGEYLEDQDALEAAKREFKEETGFDVPGGGLKELKPLKQPSGKIVSAWAIQGDMESSNISSNTFSMEWPPRSGKMQEFPEVDKAAWFDLETAKTKILKGQSGFLEQLKNILNK